MKSKKELKKETLLLLPLLLIGLTVLSSGCSLTRPILIHPIEKSDIFDIPAGATVEIPAGTTSTDDKGKVIYTWENDESIPVEKQGWFWSDYYVQKVAQVKVEEKSK